MSIGTFAELKAAVANWLDRGDLTDRIPEFIALSEAQMARDLISAGGVRRMVTRSTASLSDEFAVVPTDFGGARSFKLDGHGALELIHGDDMADRKARDPSVGVPFAYAVVGGEFEFFPVPQETFTGVLTYYARPEALGDSNATNWVLTDHPDAYLYGTLLQAAPYLRDAEQAVVWNAGYANATRAIIATDAIESYGGAPTMRRRTFG